MSESWGRVGMHRLQHAQANWYPVAMHHQPTNSQLLYDCNMTSLNHPCPARIYQHVHCMCDCSISLWLHIYQYNETKVVSSNIGVQECLCWFCYRIQLSLHIFALIYCLCNEYFRCGAQDCGPFKECISDYWSRAKNLKLQTRLGSQVLKKMSSKMVIRTAGLSLTLCVLSSYKTSPICYELLNCCLFHMELMYFDCWPQMKRLMAVVWSSSTSIEPGQNQHSKICDSLNILPCNNDLSPFTGIFRFKSFRGPKNLTWSAKIFARRMVVCERSFGYKSGRFGGQIWC